MTFGFPNCEGEDQEVAGSRLKLLLTSLYLFPVTHLRPNDSPQIAGHALRPQRMANADTKQVLNKYWVNGWMDPQ